MQAGSRPSASDEQGLIATQPAPRGKTQAKVAAMPTIAEALRQHADGYWVAKQAEREPIEKSPLRCAACGGEMQLTAIIDGDGRLLYNHPLPSLDFG